MERKKVLLSLKTGTSKKRSEESTLEGMTSQNGSLKKAILRESTSNKTTLSRSRNNLTTEEKSKAHDESFDFHCSFETNSGAEQDNDIPSTQPVSHDQILEGVVAFIEVRSNTENRFDGISKQVEMLGATVVKKLTPEVTHVIFKDGKRTIRERALKKGIYLVSVLWVESCRQSGKRVSEDLFPVISPEEAATPLLVGRLKRTKSMQPKAFEEDVQNSADRGDRRRRRKLQAENLTPTAVIFCAETQDPHSPLTFNSPVTPHIIPDTPSQKMEKSPFIKALNYDDESPGEPITSGKDHTDQLSDINQEIPPSISKLRRRLLSKSTPSNLPTPPMEQKETPSGQIRKTPKDVILTGSEQGKKRKRQESTREALNEDVKAGVAKRKKKTKVVEEVQREERDHEELITDAERTKSTVQNISDAKKGRKERASQATEDEKCVTAGTDDEKKKQDSVSRKKKTPAKPGKKFPSGHNSDQTGENMNSDSGVSVTESNSKSSLVNRVSFRHKRFSKTAELVDQATKAVEFDDSLVTEDNERQHENNVKAKLNVSKTKKNLLRKNTVKKVKLVSPAKLESQVSIGKNKGKDGFDIKSSVLQQNDENMKSGRLSSEESQSDDEDADAEGSTCTEEDEQELHLKKNRKTERKQRTKLVKKVKPKRSIVMTSMHFGEQDIVLSVVRKLGGFFIEDRVSSSTSHVIAGSPRRTLNVLMAVAQGSWLVSSAWVMKSLEVGYWVDEEPYELSDAFPAAQLCRLERISAGPGYHQELFAECPPMYVSENCAPPSDSLTSLIGLCGGKVSTSVRNAGICIGSMARKTQVVNVTEQWILDCITQHTVLPFASFALNTPAKRRREASPSY